jgi:phosphopantothenoylcysteine synthetase/decarboxylase
MPTEGVDRRVLYVVACAAPPAQQVDELVRAAEADGWQVCVIATPNALAFLDVPELETLTGYPVRSTYKHPSDADALPPAQAIAVAPATFNTVNKWAAGISDTLALGLLTEAIGKGLPIVAMPFLNRAQAAHPAFEQSLQRLRASGVRVLYGSDILELHEPGGGFERARLFPWTRILDAINRVMSEQDQRG